MNTLIFAAGLLLGALSAFVFMFITTAISSHERVKKVKEQIVSEDLIRELWHDYVKEMKKDGK